MPKHDEQPNMDGSSFETDENWGDDPRWMPKVRQIHYLEKSLPDDSDGVAVAQNGIRLILELEDQITEEQQAVLHGLVTVLYRQAKQEMSALLQTVTSLAAIRRNEQ